MSNCHSGAQDIDIDIDESLKVATASAVKVLVDSHRTQFRRSVGTQFCENLEDECLLGCDDLLKIK